MRYSPQTLKSWYTAAELLYFWSSGGPISDSILCISGTQGKAVRVSFCITCQSMSLGEKRHIVPDEQFHFKKRYIRNPSQVTHHQGTDNALWLSKKRPYLVWGLKYKLLCFIWSSFISWPSPWHDAAQIWSLSSNISYSN